MEKIKKYGFLFGLSIFIVVFFVSLMGGIAKDKASTSTSTQESAKKIIYTTEDLKTDYEILGILIHYQQLGSFGLKDPLLGAINKGNEEFAKKAAAAGADAVVGMRYLFANRTEKDEGRLLIYGTAVKFK